MRIPTKLVVGLLAVGGVAIIYLNRQPQVDASPIITGNQATFAGYDCTEDCSGHEAGYDWADEHGIDDQDLCDDLSTNSESFKEGCKAYVSGGDREPDDQADPDASVSDEPDSGNERVGPAPLDTPDDEDDGASDPE
jgi:hypothetical protein